MYGARKNFEICIILLFMLKLIKNNIFLVLIFKIYNLRTWDIFCTVRIFTVDIRMINHLRIQVHKVGIRAVVHTERIIFKVLTQIKVFYLIFCNIYELLYYRSSILIIIRLRLLVVKILKDVRIKNHSPIRLK